MRRVRGSSPQALGRRVSRAQLTSAELVEGYDDLFAPLMRAAHRACFERAVLTREDRWPTVEDCLAFARLYGVSPAELAAFFGYLSWVECGRTVWVDALRGSVSSWAARRNATPAQAVAFGFQCAFADTVRPSLH